MMSDVEKHMVAVTRCFKILEIPQEKLDAEPEDSRYLENNKAIQWPS